MSVQPRWRAWLAEDARAAMLKAGGAAHPYETGGVLVGVHTHGTRPWITHAIELPSPRSTRAFYEVPAGARRKAVRKVRAKDPRLGYLGEWHVHPLDMPPSQTDVMTIARLAADPDSGCSRPILLVVRRTAAGYALDARQLTPSALRELRIISTGKLPERVDVRTRDRRRSTRGFRPSVR